MSQPGNTAACEFEDEFGPDLLSDPTFVPCRNEGCPRKDLHAEHPLVARGRKIHQGYSKCPLCQTSVVVTKTKRKREGDRRHRSVIKAECPNCGWAHTKALKKEDS